MKNKKRFDSSASGAVLEWARQWSYAHPRLRMRIREAWGISRQMARSLHLPAPFEPAEFGDLRRVAATAPVPTEGAETVLVLSFRGWSTHVVIETTIGHALIQAGARPIFATCGGGLPTCDVVPTPFAPPPPCRSCAGYAGDAIAAAGFEAVTLHDLVDVRKASEDARLRVAGLATVEQCAAFEEEGLPLGQLVRVSVAWFLSVGRLTDTDPITLPTYREFLASAIVLADSFGRLLDRVGPHRIFLLNGGFFPERILAELAERRSIPVMRYERGFFPRSIVMNRWRAGHADEFDPGDEEWRVAENRPLEPAERDTIDRYLAERRHGGRTFDNFWAVRVEDEEQVRRDLNLAGGRPLVVAFCNILWDEAVQNRDRAFPSMGDWLIEAVEWASRRPDIDLVVRIHPAEVKLLNHPSREPMAEHLARRFAVLPSNVRVVRPESPVSSYTLISMADIALVYASTIGIEVAAMGVPAVVAAVANYTGRGFTIEPSDATDYWDVVDSILVTPPPSALCEHRRDLALRYAYLFFFRYHQHLRVIDEPGRSRVRLTVGTSEDLGVGRDPALDRVVDAILHGNGPLVTPAGLGHLLD